MRQLTVLYDGDCGLCIQARNWLARQPKYLTMRFIAHNSPEAHRHYHELVTAEALEELIVVSDDGKVYRDNRAWIMCLYALREYRPLALRLSQPGLWGLARRSFSIVSRYRHHLSRWLVHAQPTDLARQLPLQPESPRCDRSTT